MAKRKIQTRKQRSATRGHIVKPKPKKIVAEQVGDVLGNGAEKVVTPEEASYMQDTREPEIPMETLEESVKRLEAEELASAKEQAESEREILEPEPFNPKKLVADLLKKKDGV